MCIFLRDGQSVDRIPVRARFFSHVQTGPGAHTTSCSMGTWSFPRVKRPGRGADHPPLPSAEVKNELGYNSALPLDPWWPVIGWTLPSCIYLHIYVYMCICISFSCKTYFFSRCFTNPFFFHGRIPRTLSSAPEIKQFLFTSSFVFYYWY
jgi:hypothetical protein